MVPSRQPNRRGEGGRLRGEIVAAAAAVLEETGNEDSVTLRAVARRVGIAAPSIYGHFADRDQILLAVITVAFGELDAALAAATDESEDRLRAVCRAYLRFAASRPHRYRVMFARHRAGAAGVVNDPRVPDELVGAAAFGRLVEAVAEHQGEGSGPPLQSAIALWVALHGYISLHCAVPAFPWPAEDVMVDDLITRIGPRPGAVPPGPP
jgi:AcrR family transcriptional regulator